MGRTIIQKTPAKIENMVLRNYPTARNIVIKTDMDGNNYYYEAKFVTDKFKGVMKMDPVTGAVCERELDYF